MVQEGDVVWSNDGEMFHDEIGDAIDSMYYNLSEDESVVGKVIFKGTSNIVTAEDLVCVNRVLEDIGEIAYDIVGEHAEDYPDYDKDAYKELEQLLCDWINRHCKPNFYTVKNVEEYIITEDDL